MAQRIGFKHTEESKRKISQSHIGKKRPTFSKEWKNKLSIAHQGEKNSQWKGGRIKRMGYFYIHKLNHPFASRQGYIAEHRFIVEKYLGRYLKSNESVHHLNKKITDNRIENLMTFISVGKHTNFERGLKIKPEEIIFDGRNARPYHFSPPK